MMNKFMTKMPMILSLWMCVGALMAAERQPNVLFIIVDDLNDSVDGFGGHPQARTPNIDRLAKQGIKFTNAQSNAAINAKLNKQI